MADYARECPRQGRRLGCPYCCRHIARNRCSKLRDRNRKAARRRRAMDVCAQGESDMTHITLGHAERKPLYLDLPILLRTRLLIQANSGGGKSYALRRILEQAFGKVQCIVIDPAGEFSTLREKYDFILIGEHCEAQVDIRSAGLLATRLLELRAPAIIDLYSLKPAERHIWVQRYFEATRSEEHTSELQSPTNLVCRLLLEKKKRS